MIAMRFLHKWIGIFLGVQLVIWMFSGFLMSWFSHDEVKGKHLKAHAQHHMMPLAAVKDMTAILSQIPTTETIHAITVGALRHQSVVFVRTNQSTRMFNTETNLYTPITAEVAQRIAEDDFSGDGVVVKVQSIIAPTMETRKNVGSGWRVDFDNDENSSLYISADTGQIWERRHDLWRTFDIFWMLHIMDYSNRKDFNNWIVILSSWIVLWLTLSGFIMLIENIKLGDFNLWAMWRNRTKVKSVTIKDTDGSGDRKYKFAGHLTLLDALATEDIHLPSSCGGGGNCGLCRVKMEPAPQATPADIRKIPSADVDQGYRLSCQHRNFDQKSIKLPRGLVDAKTYEMEVVAHDFVAANICEVRMRPTCGSKIVFTSGDYIQVTIPEFSLNLSDLALPFVTEQAWSKGGFDKAVNNSKILSRPYSIANAIGEFGPDIMLNVKLAMPSCGSTGAPVGRGSTYISSLKKGDVLQVKGPLGDFCLKESDNEKIFIGGGAGMAPLRSMIVDSFGDKATKAKCSFWYGAHTQDDLFYKDDFDELADKFDNFEWTVALSTGDKEWVGKTGYIHTVVLENYLQSHPNIQACEFYVCGPPLMLVACLAMLKKLGVTDDQIACDDFGI